MDPLALEAVRLAALEVSGVEDERVARLGATVAALAGALVDAHWDDIRLQEQQLAYMTALERRSRRLAAQVESLTAALGEFMPIEQEDPHGPEEPPVAF
jgi:uncharacterized coiled-coil protein SlyX